VGTSAAMKSFESLLTAMAARPVAPRRAIRRRLAHDRLVDSGLPPLLQRIYSARGCERAEELGLALDRLIPVAHLEQCDAAAELLAAHRGGRVLIVGDFDADGATSTALMLRALRAFGFAHVDFLVPNRFQFGYGLTWSLLLTLPFMAAIQIVRRGQSSSTSGNERWARGGSR